MSRLNKLILSLLIFVAPAIASAKTLSYKETAWQINPQITSSSQSIIIRNNFGLKNLSKHVLLNSPLEVAVVNIDADTLSQVQDIIAEVNQPVSSAKIKIENSWATEFIPDKNGLAVDTYKLIKSLSSTAEELILPIIISAPQTKLSDLNSLGINELIAVGESDFTGSSQNRLTNIKVGASKYNGLILNPGEEFSFNKYLGEIDAAHGFKPEQVIKASGIELEFGGGLCQVSTTMFRAAMNAGLPIVARRNHSFAVKYYAPQGTDATIYPGASDLKFVNNFKNPILIHTYVASPHVYFEVYGTKDDRVVTFEGPVQYDKKPDGSMKATWTRHVALNGETTTYVAKSSYVSPNLYKKVDAVSTPNPQAETTPANSAINPTQPAVAGSNTN